MNKNEKQEKMKYLNYLHIPEFYNLSHGQWKTEQTKYI